MSDHALLSASDSGRWGGPAGCAAALHETRDTPRTSSPAASWGTAAHEIGAWCLENRLDAIDYPNPTIEADGRVWPVDEEMRECVQDYLDFVRERIGDGHLLVEQKVRYGPLLFGDAQIVLEGGEDVHPADIAWGTSDTVILGDTWIRVIDLKTGANANNKVGADHPQLKLYALGALYEYEMLGEFDTVTVSICQPRLDHYPEHTFTVAELKAFAAEMGLSGLRALEVYASRDPQPEHYAPGDPCKWCGAKAACPALRAMVTTETRDLFASVMEGGEEAPVAVLPLADVPQDRLSRAMRMAPLLEELVKALRAETERRLLAGIPVEGFKLVEGRRGARKWSDPEKALRVLKRKLGAKDATYPAEVISPTDAEKRLAKLDKTTYDKLLKPLVEQSDGKPSVAPESDSKPALKRAVDGLAALAAPMEDLV